MILALAVVVKSIRNVVDKYMKSLIIYYSQDGSNELIAQKIKDKFNSDVFRIKQKKEHKGHRYIKMFWQGREVVMKKTPEIEALNKNLDDYELIFIGSPVWVGTFTPAMRTFLKNNKIQDKRIVLFCSYGGSPSKIFTEIKNNLEGNEIIAQASFKEPIKNPEEKEKLENWVQSLKVE